VSEDTKGHVRRRLAAILFADYSQFVPGDEAESFTGLTLLRTEIIEPQVLKCRGNIIRWTGDGVLIEFESVVEAVRCRPLPRPKRPRIFTGERGRLSAPCRR